MTAPTRQNGRIYVTAETESDNRLFALDASTGAVEWRFSESSERGTVSLPAVADDTAFFATADITYAVNTDGGTEVWQTDRGGSPALVVGGVLYGLSANGAYALDAGVAGSSDDSLVRQGTRGHHNGLGGDSVTLTSRQEDGVSVTTEERDNRKETTVSVAEAPTGDPVTIPLNLRVSASTTIDELVVTPEVDGGFELTITSNDHQLETTPAGPMLAVEDQLGFFSIDSTLADADIAEVAYRYRIDPDATNATIDPQEVALYRFETDTDRWAAYPTDVTDEGETLAFETVAPGFSEWTVGTDRPEISITDAEAEVSTVQTGEQFDIDVTLENPD